MPRVESIRAGVAQIDRNVDGTIGIAEAVRTDVRNILGQAADAVQNAACIQNKTATVGNGPTDPDCRP